jgi:hypothetical protein
MVMYKNFPIDWRGRGYYKLYGRAGCYKLIRCGHCRDMVGYITEKEIVIYG